MYKVNANRGDAGTYSPSIVFVQRKADLPAASNGVISLRDNTNYFFTSNVDLMGDRLVAGQNTVILGGSSENCNISSTGLSAGTALLTSEWSLPIRNVSFTHALMLDLDADGNADQALDWFGVNFLNCASVGRIANYSNFIMTDSALLNSANMEFDGSIGTIGFNQCLFSGIAGQTTLNFPSSLTVTRRIRVIYSSFIASGGATAINVSSSATIPVESYILDTVNFSGGATYTAGVTYTSNTALFQNCKGITNSGEIGQMYFSSNASATSVAQANTFYKITGTTAAGSINQKFSHSSNRLTYTGAITRAFKVTGIASVVANSGNRVSLRVGKDGTTLAESDSKATISATNRFENLACHAIVELATNNYIELFVANDSVQNVTVEDLNVIIEALN